jgi:hypothetical protein
MLETRDKLVQVIYMCWEAIVEDANDDIPPRTAESVERLVIDKVENPVTEAIWAGVADHIVEAIL